MYKIIFSWDFVGFIVITIIGCTPAIAAILIYNFGGRRERNQQNTKRKSRKSKQ